MARKHIFPVCRPSFNILDFATVDESQSYYMAGTTEAYGGVSSTGVETAVFFGKNSSDVAFSAFIIEDGGEYLVNDDISIPSETTLDWTGDANGIQLNVYSFGSIRNDPGVISVTALNATKATKELEAGEVICIGSKPPSSSSFKRNVIPATWHYNTDGTFTLPLSDDDPLFKFILSENDAYDSTGIAWVTLMWSGTRWVYMGSNTWV